MLNVKIQIPSTHIHTDTAAAGSETDSVPGSGVRTVQREITVDVMTSHFRYIICTNFFCIYPLYRVYHYIPDILWFYYDFLLSSTIYFTYKNNIMVILLLSYVI